MSVHAHPDMPTDPARNVAGHGSRVNATTRPRITVERPVPDRLMVTIQRRQVRVFSLDIREAAELVAELIRHAPELTGMQR